MAANGSRVEVAIDDKILLRFAQALKCSDDECRNADLTRRHATQGCLIVIQQPVQK
jgi:hypothetical protein